MSNDLTPSEARFVRALCQAGPLGIAPLGLARALGVTTATVGNLSAIIERKGFCTRERYGMRIFLRPTEVARAFASSMANEALAAEVGSLATDVRRSRAPRLPRAR
jgi:DNA-binding MarR family transcriptional regulator